MINRRVWVVDVETTGKDPETDKVVEVAGILLDGPEVVKTYQTLVNPGIEIPPTASAIHHLTAADVAEAPILEVALQELLAEDVDYMVAHNAGFDSKFLDMGTTPWLCTWKLANRLWPEAPGYGNQVLRYWLGLDGPSGDSHAHRAMFDTEVTTQLFVKILEQATQDDPYPGMLQVSSSPVFLRGKVGFGEHAEKLWAEVPHSYLKWMITKDGWDENRLYTAKRLLGKA